MNRVTEERMTSLDFILGTLNAAAEADPALLLKSMDRRVDAAFHETYISLVERIDKGEISNVIPAFSISPDQFHGNSETVFEGMVTLAGLGYIVKQGYSSYYKFETGFGRTSDEIFDKIKSGSPELYRSLGQVFLKSLNNIDSR